jgi:hypothetical protein
MPRYDGRKDSTQDQIAEVWSACGWWVLDLHLAAATFRFEHLGQVVHGGIADLLMLRGGGAVFVEVKTPGGRVEETEGAFRAECEHWGVPYLIEDCVEQAVRDAQTWRNAALSGRR